MKMKEISVRRATATRRVFRSAFGIRMGAAKTLLCLYILYVKLTVVRWLPQTPRIQRRAPV